MGDHVEGLTARRLRREFTAKDGTARVAVRELDLTVRPGELVSILGTNGAGKTTTVRMLTGLLTPTSGQVTINGFDVVKQRRKAARATGWSLGGDLGLYPRLTATQNLTFFGLMYGMSGRPLRHRGDELLHQVGLLDRADDLVSTFSRGMKQRLHLARGLMHDPAVLILDEPSAGLDPHSAADMRKLLRRVADDGRSVLLTTHDMREAEELSERVILMSGGVIHTEAAPSELRLRAARDLGYTVEIRWTGTQAPESLRHCPGLLTFAHERGVTRVRAADGGAAAQWVLAQHREQVANVSVSPPTLEEIFLDMTKAA